MMKKLLFTTVTLAIAAAITSGLYLGDQKQYQQRNQTEKTSSEPYSMLWAKTDLRTGEYNPNASQEVKSFIRNRVKRDGVVEMDFESRGPDNVGGRTRALVELIGKPDTLFAGSVTGGLWVSYNGGGNWEPHSQFNNLDSSSSIIASIHQDTNNKYIYVGTGSSFDDNATTASVGWPGFGMYVSKDEGATFQHITSTTPDDRYTTSSTPGGPWIAVNRIKTNSQGHIYAATNRGMFMSTDEGETWVNPVYFDEDFQTNYTDICADISIGTDDRVLVSYAGGRVYLSPNGSDESFVWQTGNGLPSGARRTAVAIAESNPDVMYVLYNVGPIACLGGIYRSLNGGSTFTKILEPHDDFSPMQGGADYCQGVYDLAFECDPRDPNTIFIGGVELWRYDGSLTRVASEAGSPPNQDILPFYVHADKHLFYFSPNDKRRMYVTSDGGISRTSDRGNTWQGLNKGYVTTQFYGITHFNGGGAIIGGTQDNGTLVVLALNPNDPNVGYQVFGNDGIDCDASQNMPIVFASSQNGLVVRADVSAGTNSEPPYSFFSGMESGGPFRTVVKLWENANDLTSQDSIYFKASQTQVAIATGNGILRNFTESVSPVQPAAEVVESTVKIVSGGLELTIDPENPGNFIGDGVGTITFNNNSMDVVINFDEAPTENANILINFEVTYDANDVVYLQSDNLKSLQGGYTFEHRLESDMNPGDSIKVQDPVQSVLLSTGQAIAGGGIRLYRNVLNAQKQAPAAIGITGVGGGVTCIEFADDGNTAFIGSSNGGVYRVTGLNQVYTQEDADTYVSSFNIMGGSGFNGAVTGLAIDHNDNNRLIVTGGGYGQSNRVFYTDNALASNPTFTNVHGDLAPMPIYDAEFNVNEPNMVLVGTEFGLWATGDITASGGVSWTDMNNQFTYVPIYDIRQQWLPFEKATNTGIVYVGTHGRGFWESRSLVGVPEFGDIPARESAIADFKVYPNPVQGAGQISFESNFNGLVDLKFYDLNGRQVKAWQERTTTGKNNYSFTTDGLRSGAYFATIESNGKTASAKFMVMR